MQKTAEKQIEDGLHGQLVVSHMTKVSNLWSKIAVESVRVLSHPDFEESSASQYVKEIHEEFATLIQLLERSPSEQESIKTLQKDTDEGLSILGKARDAWFYGQVKKYHGYLKDVGRVSDLCTERSNKLLDQFTKTQQDNYREQIQSREHLSLLLFTGLLFNISTALIVAYLFTASIARRLEQIGENSMRLASGEQLLPALPGRDEIANLDKEFHVMAGALKEAARKERAVVDNALDLICSLDADGVFLMVNPASEAILGYEPKQLLGEFYVNFVVEEDRERAISNLHNLKDGVSIGPFENAMLKSDGGTVNMLISAHWSDTDKSMFCVMHDITQRREMERMKQQFIAMITHDLRSPLTAIGGTLQLLSAGIYSSESETGKERIGEATQNTERMLKLISDLLEMEKFDATTLTLSLSEISLPAVIEESIGSVRSYAEQQNITLKSSIAHITVEADRLRMVQVLVNLLSNAIKFSAPGTSVEVTCSEAEKFARIQVVDTGTGISPEEQELIFEPFKQAKRKDSDTRLEGTGLGLAICKSIVEAHHGKIGVVSGETGSTFWVEIPIAKSD